MLMILRNALVGLFVLGLASTALAQDPEAGDVEPVEGADGDIGDGVDDTAEVGGGGSRPFSAGLLLGYGIGFDEINFWGLGFGLRGGYNLEAAGVPEVYVGARFMYYLGEDPVSHWELGIEGGYEIPVGPVVIRPALGLGVANLTVEIPANPFIANSDTTTASEAYLYISLGGTVLYDINEQFFVGGEMNLNFVLADPEGAEGLTILANGGMRF